MKERIKCIVRREGNTEIVWRREEGEEGKRCVKEKGGRREERGRRCVKEKGGRRGERGRRKKLCEGERREERREGKKEKVV